MIKTEDGQTVSVPCATCQELEHFIELGERFRDPRLVASQKAKLEKHRRDDHAREGTH